MTLRSLLKSLIAISALCLSLNASANLIFNFDKNLENNLTLIEYRIDNYILKVTTPTNNGSIFTGGAGRLAVLSDTIQDKNNNIGRAEQLDFLLTDLNGNAVNFNGQLNIVFSGWDKKDRARISGAGIDNTTYGNDNGTFSTFLSGDGFSVKGHRAGDGFRVSQVALIPEPSTLAVLSLGLLAFSLRRFKHN
ncbi:PEP-CTERM sorting domain-containing protein [uncultured Paraglaciecola sp.]|mgnify:CR=1 FL=1|uniref:PEP-CTERM sorting domain-containing protein n=1 Tax=uncultured Paraglaciecola sp. TaxID=1765024 RepID=UPI0026255F23|nr:PEP-CTERM sorting domain-containing protein [uncultured Paraglaciecola sp.]